MKRQSLHQVVKQEERGNERTRKKEKVVLATTYKKTKERVGP